MTTLMKPKKLTESDLEKLKNQHSHLSQLEVNLLSHIDAITQDYTTERNRLTGLMELQAEGMKQMSQQITSYRELIFKEGKHNVNS